MKYNRADAYQIVLIGLGAIAAAFFGVFLYREIFPEYKIYQNDYVALEEFRSSYTSEPPPNFKVEVKQIVIEQEDKGPPVIDRCISCHVALQFPHFSPTKIARDINGNIILDNQGIPVKEVNDEYIWAKLDQKIAESKDPNEIDYLSSLKIAHVNGNTYDVTKVLSMHPLIGKETRPFEFHPVDDYGCVSCHSGNGRGLTTEKAHGPVFDDSYEIEFMGPKPTFLEKDPKNDPAFARMFNEKPGHELLFQTTPILIGALIQAKCVQCHQSSKAALQSSLNSASSVTNDYKRHFETIKKGYETEKQALITLIKLESDLNSKGLGGTLQELSKQKQDYTLSTKDLDNATVQYKFLFNASKEGSNKNTAIEAIREKMDAMLGSRELTQKLLTYVQDHPANSLNEFFKENINDSTATGSLFKKTAALNLEEETLRHVHDTSISIEKTVGDQKFMTSVISDIDFLTKNYKNGEQLYISQGCYACHRISGLARGGVGPDLTFIGNSYPWYIKESIVWPQADLATSTMPNYQLDHEELQDLMTFLLAQKGAKPAISETEKISTLQEWEAGKKQPWEKPISPTQIHDLNYSMTIFAAEGCAACHRLKGYESNVGFKIEKNNKPKLEEIEKERNWFTQLFPETISGSEIVQVLEKYSEEIDQHIVNDVRNNSILENIESSHPGVIESFYTPFKFAMRAKGKENNAWNERVKRVLMTYIQEYGLGRLICPRPNWSGIFRTDEWLMEHFKNPTAHSPRSIMPAMPFDHTKFYALTLMLDKLGIRNRDELRAVWNNEGFHPEQAFQVLCSQCHGESRTGDGPISAWIYPIPKNLRNADFLRNLSKERAIESITNGVKGTPMPPWGEIAADKPNIKIPVLTKNEISSLVNWLYAEIPDRTVPGSPSEIPKWKYTPEDVLDELKRERGKLEPIDTKEIQSHLYIFPSGKGLYTSLIPKVYGSEPKDLKVSDVFDIIPSPLSGPEKYKYYIKQKFYTEKNIQTGKEFFELNCAVCHGNEADGSGARSAFMYEAKPRMLTNLDWINTRDDLRLLRSIKFGIPGTSMTAWGDLTSSLQRIQLVTFIRSLTQERERRDRLASEIYQAYDVAQINIDKARVENFLYIDKLQQQYQQLQFKQTALESKVQQGLESPQEAATLYKEELALMGKLSQAQSIDQLFIDLKNKVKEEKELYNNLGIDLIAKINNDDILTEYLDVISLNKDRFAIENGRLIINVKSQNEAEIKKIQDKIINYLNQKISELENQKRQEEAKPPSDERAIQMTHLIGELTTLSKLKQKVIADMSAAARSREEQAKLLQTLETKIKSKFDKIS